ncbi:DeoR/GlpR family DNA-binding transcription regulator [Microbacterium xylanilyticum]
MLVSERRERILAHVRERGTATIPELAGILGVSPMTIRRDIDLLADEGAVRKVRGGVRAAPHAGSLRASAGTVSAERRAVAALAAGLVEPGMAIGISGGTISLALAEALAGVPELTVVTNSLPVSELFAGPERADEPYTQTVVLTGGVRTPAQAMVGPVAVRALEQLHCDVVFLDVHGLDVQAGMTTMNLLEAETDRAFMAAGREVVVLADHGRWGTVGLTTIADLDEIDRLVIDARLEESARAQLAEHVGELLIADLGEG